MRVARAEDVRGNRGLLVRVNDTEIALFTVEGEVFALDNRCPHQHCSSLHQGEVCGAIVTCPMHGWKFDVRTGASIGTTGGKATTYPVNVRDGNVFVSVDEG